MYRQDSNTKKRLVEQGAPLRGSDNGLKMSLYDDKNLDIVVSCKAESDTSRSKEEDEENNFVPGFIKEDTLTRRRLFHELVNAVQSANYFAWVYPTLQPCRSLELCKPDGGTLSTCRWTACTGPFLIGLPLNQ